MSRNKDRVRFSVSLLIYLSLSLSLVFGWNPLCFAEVTHSNIYTGLVGDWTGYDDFVKDGHLKRVPVEISIKLERDGKSVRMTYSYASKGEPDFTKYTRFLEISTKASTISFRFEHEQWDRYKIDDLNDFAQRGLGEFKALGAAPGPHTPGAGATGRFSLELGLDKLKYTWESKPAGGDFKVVSVYTLHRSAVLPGSH